MTPVERCTIAAAEGEICPKCGERKIVRIIGAVGTIGRGMVAGVEQREACGCVPEVPQPPALNP